MPGLCGVACSTELQHSSCWKVGEERQAAHLAEADVPDLALLNQLLHTAQTQGLDGNCWGVMQSYSYICWPDMLQSLTSWHIALSGAPNL